MSIEQIPRTVKPRKTGYTDMPLLAVRRGQCLTENGSIGDVDKIDWQKLKPVLVVGVNLPHLVAELDIRYRALKSWQWKARATEMEIGTVATQQRTIVDFFGFKADPEKGHKANHYHHCLDAFFFYSNTYTLDTDTTDSLEGLLKWAMSLRDYCRNENLPLRPTASAIAASYLRDPRFYANPRRKVPRATNAAIREALPGNHYDLPIDPNSGRRWQALEIDQTRAHHYHAEHTPLPDANTLFAFGDFEALEHVCCDHPHSRFHGLYYMRLSLPHRRRSHPYHSPIKRQATGGTEQSGDFFVFTNELPMLKDLGYKCMGVIAGWGSRVQDEGIRLYARHCQLQLDAHDNAPWLKPILLSTYGLLAVRPRAPSAVYRATDKGEPYVLLAGGRRALHGLLVSHTNGSEIEPGVANVLHRGMIEAATRAESLGLAQYLTVQGQWVLQIYADSVIVEDNPDRPLPYLPKPWRCKQTLTDYRPVNLNAFISVEKTRMPGTAREEVMARQQGSGIGVAPVKPRWEALTGRMMGVTEQARRGLRIRHI